jgi:sporulation protein YlmC with PRC-barrel domain
MTEIHIELLLGTEVRGVDGQSAGRVEEILAEPRDEEMVVTEYHLGTYAMLERLSAWTIGRAILQLFGASKREGYRVPWDKLDLTDPSYPRLTCPLGELEVIKSPRWSGGGA